MSDLAVFRRLGNFCIESQTDGRIARHPCRNMTRKMDLYIREMDAHMGAEHD